MAEIKDLKVDQVSLVGDPANDWNYLSLRKHLDDSPIQAAHMALQSLLNGDLELSEQDKIAIQQTMKLLQTLDDTTPLQEEIPNYPLPNFAKEALEAVIIKCQEAGQRHSTQDLSLIDQIIELLKKLRGKSPQEQSIEDEKNLNNGVNLSLAGYQNNQEFKLVKRNLNFQESRLLTALDSEGSEWEICIIESGYSKNGVTNNGKFIPRYYPLQTLQESTKLFEGARVYVYARPFNGQLIGDHLSDEDLKKNPNGYAKDLVGFIKNPQIRGSSLIGTLHIFEGASWLRKNLREAFQHNQNSLYNLSIDSDGSQRLGQINGKPALIVEALYRVASVDVVTFPAAGGRFLRLVASLKPGEIGIMGDENKSLLDKIEQFEMRQLLRTALQESGLPAIQQAKIRQKFSVGEIDPEKLEEAIDEAKAKMQYEQKEMKKAKKDDEEYPYPMPKKKMKHEDEDKIHMKKAKMEDDEEMPDDEEEEEEPIKKAATGVMVKKAGDRYVVFKDGKIVANKATEEEANAAAKSMGMKESYSEWLDKRFEKMAQALDEKIMSNSKLTESANYLVATIADSGLPIKAQRKLTSQFGGRIFESTDLDKEIEFLRDIAASNDTTGDVNISGQSREIRVTESEWDKLCSGLDGFWAGEDLKGPDGSKIRHMRSLQEAYTYFTKKPYDVQVFMAESFGEKRYDSHGRYGVQAGRLTEALTSSSWSLILGDSITRRLLAEYNVPSLQTWRQIVSEVGNIKDFRTQRRMRLGGYGVLPTVTQADSYVPLTSPTDEEARFTITKKGGLETITIEMMANDDVGSIRRIPRRLGRAAAQTLYRGVFDILDTNASLNFSDDTTALFTSAHANIGSVALSADSLDAAIIRMKRQAAYGDSREVLGLVPRFIIYPPNLDRLVDKLLLSNLEPQTADNDANPFLRYKMERIEVFYWTDTNNWYLSANPQDIPTLEVGFFNGNEDPELFVSDQENVSGSSMFAADKVTYKIRHIWGVGVMDFRWADGSLV